MITKGHVRDIFFKQHFSGSLSCSAVWKSVLLQKPHGGVGNNANANPKANPECYWIHKYLAKYSKIVANLVLTRTDVKCITPWSVTCLSVVSMLIWHFRTEKSHSGRHLGCSMWTGALAVLAKKHQRKHLAPCSVWQKCCSCNCSGDETTVNRSAYYSEIYVRGRESERGLRKER